MAVLSLGYVRIEMRDPDEWRQVGEEVLGFTVVQGIDDCVRLRMDEAPFRYLVEPGDEDRFACAGWECAADKLDGYVAAIEAQGVIVQQGDAAGCRQRGVARFVTAADPSGNTFELFSNREAASEPYVESDRAQYVAGDMGLGHVVLPALAHAETCAFYQEVLGFGLSDELTLPPPMEGVPEMKINFLHADNPRHHSLALFNGPAPSGVVHLMTEMRSLDQVGACLDRVNAAGLPITASMGRHSNDQMVSFYFLAPAGIPMEVGYDGLQLDWNTFTPTRSTVGDVWGHEYNFPE